jgi:conjugal transfer/entry exclusion protein
MKKVILTGMAMALVAALPLTSPGTMAVLDYSNLTQNVITALKQVNSVLGTVSMFQGGQSQLQGYLNRFQNVNYWLSASPNSYTYQTAGSIAQKQANDALVKGIVAQQAQIRADAATLQQLQSQASTADGQMKALMAANQLEAHTPTSDDQIT